MGIGDEAGLEIGGCDVVVEVIGMGMGELVKVFDMEYPPIEGDRRAEDVFRPCKGIGIGTEADWGGGAYEARACTGDIETVLPEGP